ncbi:enoyl-CoA hydratase-related protein [Schleiferiaceae bacterium]|nr:enoyl-CoA hydratase/isomerase family protein [Cryomorphaceae bacterium]MBT6365692.1 enoyl-CoA hydratase [Bacteroidota bacterium]MCO4774567.1 enoyl-CoA hydratase/isomerase family protein [Flavobacteriales bacterium]MDA7721535.1 enoyl-CoA hydratase-related protein [Schleiferiaceae bacterium]MDB4346558.1 enoyl-CoA hydratase-related protein [bacterium]
MQMENVQLTVNEGIATLVINRPKQLNALNKQTLAEISEAFESMRNDDGVKVVIMTGSGEKAFVAGADIKEFANFSGVQGSELAKTGHMTVFNSIEEFSKPVIAAINGFALGGGLELAMAAHVRIASDNARMGLPETSLGVIPGYGGTQRLPQLIGKGRALEMIFSAKMIDAATALNYGLVNAVVPQEALQATAENMALGFMKNSIVAMGYAVEAVNAGMLEGAIGYDVEVQAFGDCFETADFKEGTKAFLEKRKPEFPGS